MAKNIFYGIAAVNHPTENGYAGEYRAPGLTPAYAVDDNGSPKRYGDQIAAEHGAAQRLIQILNSPRARANGRQGKRDNYQKLTGPEFAALLEESGITLTLLGYIIGTREPRLYTWLDGFNDKGEEERAPHHVRVLLEIFKQLPEAIDIADRVTKQYATEANGKARAPFTADQVEALRDHQADESRHPLTCPGDRPQCQADRNLVPTVNGLICQCGAYTQDWVPEKMAQKRSAK